MLTKTTDGTGNGQYGKGLKELNTIDAIAGLLQGYYLGNEERTQCAMDSIGNKWKFYLKVRKNLPTSDLTKRMTRLTHV